MEDIVGKTLSYRDITTALELPYYRGNQKNAQLKQLESEYEMNKVGTKYEIIAKRDTPVNVVDKRLGSKHENNMAFKYEDRNRACVYSIELGNDVYIGQTRNLFLRINSHFKPESPAYEILEKGAKVHILEFSDDVKTRFIRERYYTYLYSMYGYNVLNTERALYKEDLQKAKPKKKKILVLDSDYEKAISVLQENNIKICY